MTTKNRRGLGFFPDPEAAYEMEAPDGSIVYRVPFSQGGFAYARYKGRIYPVLSTMHGPSRTWMATAWGSRKA